jgi:hypothetical protein
MVVLIVRMVTTTTAAAEATAAEVLLQLSFRNMLTFLRNLIQVIPG